MAVAPADSTAALELAALAALGRAAALAAAGIEEAASAAVTAGVVGIAAEAAAAAVPTSGSSTIWCCSGELEDGLGYYRFVYNGGHTAYVGVMAQEVEGVMPKAVSVGADGYLRVSYDMLGLPFETYGQWTASGAHLPSVSLK